MNDSSSVPGDADSEARLARAQRYFQRDLGNQLEWYSQRAARNKARSRQFAFLVMAGGALTSVLQVLQWNYWGPIVTAVVGAAVALFEGWRRTARYSESWTAYRVAAERMKRELRLYVNAAGRYSVSDEEIAYRHFVESIESVIAEEQQIFWDIRADHGRAKEDKTMSAGHERGQARGSPER